METHIFDTREALIFKVKTLSSEPESLSTKDIERFVQIIVEFAVKYHILYCDQRPSYEVRQQGIQRRMR